MKHSYEKITVSQANIDRINQKFFVTDNPELSIFSHLVGCNVFASFPELVELMRDLADPTHQRLAENRQTRFKSLLAALEKIMKHDVIDKAQSHKELGRNSLDLVKLDECNNSEFLQERLRAIKNGNSLIIQAVAAILLDLADSTLSPSELAKKIYDYQKTLINEFLQQFGKDIGRDGIIIIDKQNPQGKHVRFRVKEDSSKGAAALAFIKYLKTNYNVSDAQLAYLINVGHQSGYAFFYKPIADVIVKNFPDQNESVDFVIKVGDSSKAGGPKELKSILSFNKKNELQTYTIYCPLTYVIPGESVAKKVVGIQTITCDIGQYKQKKRNAAGLYTDFMPGVHPDKAITYTYQAMDKDGRLSLTHAIKLDKAQHVNPFKRLGRYLKQHSGMFAIAGATMAFTAVASVGLAIVFSPVAAVALGSAAIGVAGLIGVMAGCAVAGGLIGSGLAIIAERIKAGLQHLMDRRKQVNKVIARLAKAVRTVNAASKEVSVTAEAASNVNLPLFNEEVIVVDKPESGHYSSIIKIESKLNIRKLASLLEQEHSENKSLNESSHKTPYDFTYKELKERVKMYLVTIKIDSLMEIRKKFDMRTADQRAQSVSSANLTWFDDFLTNLLNKPSAKHPNIVQLKNEFAARLAAEKQQQGQDQTSDQNSLKPVADAVNDATTSNDMEAPAQVIALGL